MSILHDLVASALQLWSSNRVQRNGSFEGYASIFNVADLLGDVVEPGAFSRSLSARGADGVRLLWEHDPCEPVGRLTGLAEDSRGLFIHGQLWLGAHRARKVHTLIREGKVFGLSIGFHSRRQIIDSVTCQRRLIEIDLVEISLVRYPAQPGAILSERKVLPLPVAGCVSQETVL